MNQTSVTWAFSIQETKNTTVSKILNITDDFWEWAEQNKNLPFYIPPSSKQDQILLEEIDLDSDYGDEFFIEEDE